MTVTRRNIIDSAESGDRFVEGVVLLDQEMSGLTTAELNNILSPQVPGFRILGINQEVSVWDLFVLRHFLAMRMSSAHRGRFATSPTAARCSCPGTGRS